MNPKIAGIIGGLALASLVAAIFYFSGGKTEKAAESGQENKSSAPESKTETAPPAESAPIKVSISVAAGEIGLELYPDVAPKTVANFVKLAKDKFYEGVKFHRVVPDFVVQGGDPLSKTDDPETGSGGPGYQFEDEINPKALGLSDGAITQLQAAGYKYDFNLPSLPVDVGAIAMANSGPNTNGSQFFIVTAFPQPHLNGKHTVFGKVVKGMDIVRKIKQGDVIEQITVQ